MEITMTNHDQAEAIKSALQKAMETIKPENSSTLISFKSRYPEVKGLIKQGESNEEIARYLRLYGVEISKLMCAIYICAHQYAECEKLMQWEPNTVNLLIKGSNYPDNTHSDNAKALIKLANQSIPEKFEYLQIFRSIFPVIMLLIDRGFSLQQIRHFIKVSWPNEHHYDLVECITEHYLLLIENSSQWLSDSKKQKPY
jgi:hypothetical protein